MKFILIIIISIILLPVGLFADEIPSIKDQQLKEVIANLEFLGEATLPDSPMHVRIIRVRDHGECDSSPETCPKSTIYISVSQYDEAPEQAVYQLPKYHGWEFMGWKKFPSQDGPDDYVILELKAKEPSPTPELGWWSGKSFIVKVNYKNCILEEK
jgi:hypothetical protein